MAGAKEFLTGSTEIETRRGVATGLPSLSLDQIQWENKKFDPQGKDVWAGVYYRPNQPQAHTIGPQGFDRVNGFLQIDINVPVDSGEAVQLAWEEKANIFFHAGRFFTFESESVIVTSNGMSQGRIVDVHYRKSLTVAFRSHLKRNQTI